MTYDEAKEVIADNGNACKYWTIFQKSEIDDAVVAALVEYGYSVWRETETEIVISSMN